MSLALSVLLAPTVALAAQTLMYAATMWGCGRNLTGATHIIPALSLVLTGGAATVAYRHWRAAGRGTDDERRSTREITRFLSITGLAISVFSSVVVIAFWIGLFVYDPCARA